MNFRLTALNMYPRMKRTPTQRKTKERMSRFNKSQQIETTQTKMKYISTKLKSKAQTPSEKIKTD